MQAGGWQGLQLGGGGGQGPSAIGNHPELATKSTPGNHSGLCFFNSYQCVSTLCQVWEEQLLF